ncbi:DUF5403 family protein [Brachybacterium kimchii]|uniref:DUF5403 family protein n=1 Tax=Brachybacterium kimchii TaxID=2942909 RepID=A0ABY4N7X3_9MICO|nr:DUF5403 family protein [Brachybacterium kimchii]UQN30657.1 DUF5403 family protein [Brachybacterium kimchii]
MVSLSKNIGTRAAKIACELPEFDGAADGIRAEVSAEASRHSDTGHFASSIKKERVRGSRGVTDRLITSTDRAALSIEYGHFAHGSKDSSVSYVPGKHVFGTVAERHR